MALPSNGMDIDPPELSSLAIDDQENGSDAESSSSSSESIPPDGQPATVYENGRSYTNDTYFLPNDQDEQTRLSIQHQTFTLMLNRGLTMARLPSVGSIRILDIGTGPGDWALAAASKYPQATVVAIDISRASIGSACANDVPSNLHFQLDDVMTLPWTFDPESFNFIHMRGMGGAFTEAELLAVYGEALRALKPDGTLEVSDFGAVALASSSELSTLSSTNPSSSATAAAGPETQPNQSYLSVYHNALAAATAPPFPALLGVSNLSHVDVGLIERAGFRVQRCVRPPVPLGEWSENRRDHGLGRMAAVAMLERFEAVALRLLTRRLGWTAERVKELVERVKEEVQAVGARPTVHCQFVVARKLGA